MADLIIAPFSNSAIRDWPTGHFSALVGLLADAPGIDRIRVVGTANQRLRGNEIVRAHPATRVVNECGRLDWETVVAAIRRAACVIGNNSGVPHVAACHGVPTVCIFGGSHARQEWRPRGPNVVVVSRAIACSPCQLDHRNASPYGKACLRLIAPADVRRAVDLVMARGGARTAERIAEGAA